MEMLDVKASSGNHKCQERTSIFKSVTARIRIQEFI